MQSDFFPMYIFKIYFLLLQILSSFSKT